LQFIYYSGHQAKHSLRRMTPNSFLFNLEIDPAAGCRHGIYGNA